MSRIRTIKPDAFESLSLSRVPIPARWLFAGFWTLADDDGRYHDSATLIRSKVFPVDDLPVPEIESWLSALIAEGALCRYEVDGESYLHAPHFRRHQVINKPTASQRPPCPTHAPESRVVKVTVAAPRAPRQLTVLPTPEPSGEEPARRCPEHLNVRSAPRCGACKEQRITHERWDKAHRAEIRREEELAMLVPCNSSRCTCDHKECDCGFFTEEQVDPANGRSAEVQRKCTKCFPAPASSTKSARPVRSYVDARDLGADYADARAAAAGDR